MCPISTSLSFVIVFGIQIPSQVGSLQWIFYHLSDLPWFVCIFSPRKFRQSSQNVTWLRCALSLLQANFSSTLMTLAPGGSTLISLVGSCRFSSHPSPEYSLFLVLLLLLWPSWLGDRAWYVPGPCGLTGVHFLYSRISPRYIPSYVN